MAKPRSNPSKPAPARAGKRAARPTRSKNTKRPGSKQARLIAMLRSPEGATVARIAKTFGWQTHTVRGVFSGALKKKLGLAVTSEKAEGGERVYRIA